MKNFSKKEQNALKENGYVPSSYLENTFLSPTKQVKRDGNCTKFSNGTSNHDISFGLFKKKI